MGDRDRDRRRFEEAARHVTELGSRITAQEAKVAKLDQDGRATGEAPRLLESFRIMLKQARIHELMLLKRLSVAPPTSG